MSETGELLDQVDDTQVDETQPLRIRVAPRGPERWRPSAFQPGPAQPAKARRQEMR